MELNNLFKQNEGKLSLVGDKVTQMSGKLEDLSMRARKIGNQLKEKGKTTDSMFGNDLQIYRRDVRSFAMEVMTLSSALSAIEREMSNTPSPGYDKQAQALMRLAGRVSKAIQALHSTALMAHQLMREPDHRIQGFYICQEIEEMVQKTQSLPNIAQKIVLRAAEADSKAAPPSASAPPTPPAA